MLFMIGLWTFLRALLSGSAAIALENLALRHRLAVLQRSVRPTTPITMGSDPLGLAVPRLGGVAVQPGHRAARHRSGLAPPRLPALLALAVLREPRRPAAARRRDSPPHPTHGAGECDLGPAAHPGGARPARPPDRRAHRRQGAHRGSLLLRRTLRASVRSEASLGIGQRFTV